MSVTVEMVECILSGERNVDRKKWGPGPWDREEIDEGTFTWKGYLCRVSRNGSGNWCGYVRLPKGSRITMEQAESAFEVHGGVTYCRREEDKHLWVGFDCGHAGDIIPAFTNLKNYGGGYFYRTMGYTINEIKKLVKQIQNATH